MVCLCCVGMGIAMCRRGRACGHGRLGGLIGCDYVHACYSVMCLLQPKTGVAGLGGGHRALLGAGCPLCTPCDDAGPCTGGQDTLITLTYCRSAVLLCADAVCRCVRRRAPSSSVQPQAAPRPPTPISVTVTVTGRWHFPGIHHLGNPRTDGRGRFPSGSG